MDDKSVASAGVSKPRDQVAPEEFGKVLARVDSESITKLVQNKIASIPKPGYSQDTVDYLKKLLATAERGEMSEFVIIYKEPGGTFKHCWTGSENILELIGFLTVTIAQQTDRCRQK